MGNTSQTCAVYKSHKKRIMVRVLPISHPLPAHVRQFYHDYAYGRPSGSGQFSGHTRCCNNSLALRITLKHKWICFFIWQPCIDWNSSFFFKDWKFFAQNVPSKQPRINNRKSFICIWYMIFGKKTHLISHEFHFQSKTMLNSQHYQSIWNSVTVIKITKENITSYCVFRKKNTGQTKK